MLKVREKKSQSKEAAQEKALTQCPYEKRASRNTSCSDGMSAPVPRTEATQGLSPWPKRRPPSPDSSGWVRSFFNQSCTVVISCPGGPISQSGVNRELGPMPKGEPINHNLQPASVQIVEHCRVHVSHVHVRGDPGPCLAADLSSSALERKQPSPRTPATAHAARWWPNMSSWRPHRQVRMERGRGKCKLLQEDGKVERPPWLLSRSGGQ